MSLQRIGQLHEKLTALANKRNLAADPLWAEAWDMLNAELLSRLLETEHGDDGDMRRAHLVVSMRSAGRLRAIMEGRGEDAASLERELDILEGRRLRPIA